MAPAVADPVAAARRWAALYRSWGYQPLPSDDRPASEGGRKKPLVRFAHLWEAPAGEDLFARFRTRNVQLMTGRRWDLAVLDLDGPEAVRRVTAEWPKLPRTWTVWHSRGGREGRHLWFRLPRGLGERRKRVLWAEWDGAAGGWRKHAAVELLIDGSLVVAPPSVHPETRNAYGFAAGLSPANLPRPALLPCWVLDMPPVAPPESARPPAAPVAPPPPPAGRGGPRASLRHVLDAITDKASVARDLWGLRFAARPSESAGWVSCHDPFREDANPSARFHLGTGGLWRPGERVVPFCEIPVRLGLFRDYRETVADLSARFNPR